MDPNGHACMAPTAASRELLQERITPYRAKYQQHYEFRASFVGVNEFAFTYIFP